MSNSWYLISTDRLSFFTVHWANGARITIPYASVRYMTTVPEGTIVIQAGTIKIVAQVGPKRDPRKDDMKIVADALTGGSSTKSSAKAGAKTQGAGTIKGSARDVPAEPQGASQTVEEFQAHFQTLQMRGLFHVPDLQVRVAVLKRTREGYEPFPVREDD